jgi:glycosyltransferase involved in cell wall biosynthesis
MKKVLVISWAFPPMGVVGVYRPSKFCKFLPSLGWQPVVLTVKNKYVRETEYALLDELDETVRVYHSSSFEPLLWWDHKVQGKKKASGAIPVNEAKEEKQRVGNSDAFNKKVKLYLRVLLSIPDRHNTWVFPALREGLKIIKKEKINIIFSTSPPFTDNLIGAGISLLTGLPLVTDFRDLWTLNESYETFGYPKIGKLIDRLLERWVVLKSSAIVTTTDSFTAAMKRKNAFKDGRLFFTIPNGLDKDDFRALTLPVEKTKRFTMLHLGNLYGNRDPEFFFECVRNWVQQRPELMGNLVICFIGDSGKYKKEIEESDLAEICHFVQRISQREALSWLWEADVLLLILGFNASCTGVLPAKLFEYIATNRPVLALVPKGEAERIIKRYKRGLAITKPDVTSCCRFLDREYDSWVDSGQTRSSQFSLPEEFDRRLHAEKLAGILNQVERHGRID